MKTKGVKSKEHAEKQIRESRDRIEKLDPDKRKALDKRSEDIGPRMS